MATATMAAGGTKFKTRVRLGPIVERVMGYVIVALVAIWVVANIVADPDRFLGSLLEGLRRLALRLVRWLHAGLLHHRVIP